MKQMIISVRDIIKNEEDNKLNNLEKGLFGHEQIFDSPTLLAMDVVYSIKKNKSSLVVNKKYDDFLSSVDYWSSYGIDFENQKHELSDFYHQNMS